MGTEASSGVLLLVATVTALVWANTPWAQSYFDLWRTPVSLHAGGVGIELSLLHWVNDGLMAVFFFLVGLEIKREVLLGELSSPRKAALPIAAAFGGMVVPALIYVAFAGGTAPSGWGIPMATDIAFALGVLALLGSRAPFALKVFLTALAIVDDLGAVLVIALFYTSDLHLAALGWAAVVVVALLGLNRGGVRASLPYAMLGVVLWLLFLKSGVHATLSGVVLALTIPARVYLNPREFLNAARGALVDFEASCVGGERELISEEKTAALNQLGSLSDGVQMPLERIENSLHPYVTFGIMPIFALANAGVALGSSASGALREPLAWGIALGLLVGKPVGIFLASLVAIKTRVAERPRGVAMRHLLAAGCLGGIGFTMSLFITDVAFDSDAQIASAKVAILIASALSGVAGYLMLARRRRRA